MHVLLYLEELIEKFSLTKKRIKFFEKFLLDEQKVFLLQLKIDLTESILININKLDYIKCY